MAGYIKLHRKLMESEIFRDPAMLKTWVWILMSCNWEARRTLSGILIERGEMVTGYRKAASVLDVDKNTVMRHFQKLQSADMIRVNSGTHGTHVKVLKYSAYQSEDADGWDAGADTSAYKVADTSAYTNADASAYENKKKEVKKKEERKTYSVSFSKFWDLYPKKVGKGAANRSWKAAVKRADAKNILTAAAHFSKSSKARGKFCPNPATWLNQERWEDDPSTWVDEAVAPIYKPVVKSQEQTRQELLEIEHVALRTKYRQIEDKESKEAKELFSRMEKIRGEL